MLAAVPILVAILGAGLVTAIGAGLVTALEAMLGTDVGAGLGAILVSGLRTEYGIVGGAVATSAEGSGRDWPLRPLSNCSMRPASSATKSAR